MNIGIVQQNNTADTAQNRSRLRQSICKLAKQGAELVVLQELHDTLYFCQTEDTANFCLASRIPEDVSEYAGLARELGIVLVCSFFEQRAPGLYHNTAVVFERDGSIAGKYRKMHIPDDPGFYEKFYFAPGDLGFTPIDTSVGRIGVLVCWDQWFPEAARLMALRGAELLVYPTAIGWDRRDTRDEQCRQRDAWQLVQRGHAVANGLPLVAVNRVGREPDPSGVTPGIDFWGTSFVAGPQGELLYEAPSDKEAVALVEVDLARSAQVRQIWPFLRDRRIDCYGALSSRFDD